MVDRRKRRSDKKKVVAALLCFFVGVLGVHRFYVGKVFTGILMIVFPAIFFLYVVSAGLSNYEITPDRWNQWKWLWGIWIWVIIDFVKIITESFGDKENRGLS